MSQKIGGVLTYTLTRISGACGQSIGACGSGDYALVVMGGAEEADHKIREKIKEVESWHNFKLSNLHVVINYEGYNKYPVDVIA